MFVEGGVGPSCLQLPAVRSKAEVCASLTMAEGFLLLSRLVPIPVIWYGHVCSVGNTGDGSCQGSLCSLLLEAGMKVDFDLPVEQAGSGRAQGPLSSASLVVFCSLITALCPARSKAGNVGWS